MESGYEVLNALDATSTGRIVAHVMRTLEMAVSGCMLMSFVSSPAPQGGDRLSRPARAATPPSLTPIPGRGRFSKC